MEKYKRETYLRAEYVEKGRSTVEIAEGHDVTPAAISYWLNKHDIDTRSISEANRKPRASFRTERSGRERWQTRCDDGTVLKLDIHRLVAVAEWGFDAVCGEAVHHKNGIRWDNRAANLQIVDHAEHTRMHHERGDLGSHDEETKERLSELAKQQPREDGRFSEKD